MNTILARPEKEQKTIWLIIWMVLFIPILALCVALLFTIDKLIFGICTAGWVMFMACELFWISAFYRSLEYAVNRDSVRMKKGVFWRKQVTIPYPKITNVDVTQGPVQRMFNIGTIHVQTAGVAGPEGGKAELKMMGVRDLSGLKNAIMEGIKGYIISRPEGAKGEVMEIGESVTLDRILKEITAIRELIEKQQAK
ncbi:MAG: PH domain-containing protein [Candidatus Aminicenantes bacterium]|nr:PH domain-containing protein [Candidatus Aminicenantes bacterium]